MTSLVLWGGNFMEITLSRVELPSRVDFTLGVCLLDLLCLLWGQPNCPQARLSQGCTLSLPASCRLRVPSVLACHSLSIPCQHNLDWEQRDRDIPWEDQACITWKRHRKVVNFAQIPSEPRTPNRYLHSPSRTHIECPIEHRHIGISIETICFTLGVYSPKAILLLRHPIPHPHYWVIGPGWTLGPELFP